MVCSQCGVSGLVLKTCRRRDGEGTGTLCDHCWEPLRDLVWIIPGEFSCNAECRGCGSYFSFDDLTELTKGGKRDFSGVCSECHAVE